MSKNQGYHPYIGIIADTWKQTYITLYVDKDPLSALNRIIGIAGMLKPEDFPKELITSIENEYNYLTTTQSQTKINQRTISRRKKYSEWFRDLNKILWEKGYLENQKYEPFKLEEDKTNFG